jgi:hypothetical protein
MESLLDTSETHQQNRPRFMLDPELAELTGFDIYYAVDRIWSMGR